MSQNLPPDHLRTALACPRHWPQPHGPAGLWQGLVETEQEEVGKPEQAVLCGPKFLECLTLHLLVIGHPELGDHLLGLLRASAVLSVLTFPSNLWVMEGH